MGEQVSGDGSHVAHQSEPPSSVKKQPSLKSLKDDIDNVQHAQIVRDSDCIFGDENNEYHRVHDNSVDNQNSVSHQPGSALPDNVDDNTISLPNENGTPGSVAIDRQRSEARRSPLDITQQPTSTNSKERGSFGNGRRATEVVSCGCFRMGGEHQLSGSKDLAPMKNLIYNGNKVQKAPN